MKNSLLLILILLNIKIFAQTTNIPDPNFEQALINLGYDKGTPDGKVLTANIKDITILDVSNCNILDLTGIEAFTALTNLDCNSNKLESLDFYENKMLTNLNCGWNKLTYLSISENISLTYLYCGKNQLTSLDVSKNTKITHFSCHENLLTTLDVSKNTSLAYLYCADNKLTSLDISSNTALIYLWCSNNQLTNLNVKNNNNANLINFIASYNPNLKCITVDDKNATYLSNWNKDATAKFCQ